MVCPHSIDALDGLAEGGGLVGEQLHEFVGRGLSGELGEFAVYGTAP